MRVVRTREEFRAARDALDGPLALVPTMGALHDGHGALLRAARDAGAPVLVTIFVNPMQFGPDEDLARYPRTLEADLARCRAAGAELVWAPSVEDVYPGGSSQVRVEPGALGDVLEGAVRPGHFAGVLTVVAKLFGLTRPAVAYFGEKDYQQLTLVTRMVADLELGVAVVGVPTVREPDGLALSSRNAYLSETERRQATALSRSLFAGQGAATRGADAVLRAARAVLDAEPGVVADYLELRAADLAPDVAANGDARLLVAARVGSTRLIDNVAVTL